MFIEYDKYGLNSLRKGRVQSLQADIEQAYTVFINHMLEAEDISLEQFCRICQVSQFKYLIHCRSEQEKEEEYCQTIYQILIEQYFQTDSTPKQIFSVYAIYYFYCQQDRKRRANANLQFLNTLLQFLKSHESKPETDYMMVAKKLFDFCISVNILVGPTSLLIKPNGMPARKSLNKQISPAKTKKSNCHYQPQNEDNQSNVNEALPSQKAYISLMKQEMAQLQNSMESYQHSKGLFNFSLEQESNRLQYSDRNISVRLEKLIQDYQDATNNNVSKKQDACQGRGMAADKTERLDIQKMEDSPSVQNFHEQQSD